MTRQGSCIALTVSGVVEEEDCVILLETIVGEPVLVFRGVIFDVDLGRPRLERLYRGGDGVVPIPACCGIDEDTGCRLLSHRSTSSRMWVGAGRPVLTDRHLYLVEEYRGCVLV